MANVQGGGKRADKAAEYFGMAVSTFWRKVKEDPDFPKPVKISGSNITIFLVSELDEYLSKQVDASRKAA